VYFFGLFFVFIIKKTTLKVYVPFMECHVTCFRFVPKFWRNILRIAKKVMTECSYKIPVTACQSRTSKIRRHSSSEQRHDEI